MYLKISNLMKTSGECDYKGLDLNNIVAGTQIYDFNNSIAYIEYKGDIIEHPELQIITDTDYLSFKQQEDNKPKPLTPENRISALEDSMTALLGL